MGLAQRGSAEVHNIVIPTGWAMKGHVRGQETQGHTPES